MRNEEEFKREVYKRTEEKIKREKQIRKKVTASLCVFIAVCCAAVPVVMNMNFSRESNECVNNSLNIDENIPEKGNENATEITDSQIEIDIDYNEQQEENQETFSEPLVIIRNNESGEILTVPPEKTAELFNLLESACDIKNTGETKGDVKYSVTISSSTGEENYLISSDGCIMKNNDGQWKKISEDKQTEIEKFISENCAKA